MFAEGPRCGYDPVNLSQERVVVPSRGREHGFGDPPVRTMGVGPNSASSSADRSACGPARPHLANGQDRPSGDQRRSVYNSGATCNVWPMRERPTSRDAILVATRKAIAERGPDKLTMSAVATAASVSRPTLYRWFPTKDDLLAAIAVYEEEQFDVGVRALAEAYRSPARRLDAFLAFAVNYLDGLIGPDPIGADPQF